MSKERKRLIKKLPINVVSHPRSGVHFLMYLISKNLLTGQKRTNDIFATHFTDGFFIGKKSIFLHRFIIESMKSLYKSRSMFGIGDIEFKDFIRTKYNKMPITKKCDINVYINYTRKKRTKPKPDLFKLKFTPPEFWKECNEVFSKKCKFSVSYELLSDDVEETIRKIGKCFTIKQKYKKIKNIGSQKVGLYPAREKNLEINKKDVKYLLSYMNVDFENKYRKSIVINDFS